MVENRANLDIFDFLSVSRPLPMYYEEICTDNNSFGIGHCLRKYAGYNKGYVNGWIEHGYFWADVVSPLAANSFARNILTFGSHRVDVNRRLLPNKHAIAIGPYIHYAPDFLGEHVFKQIKKEIGRTLLVFPAHSSTGMKTEFDCEELFNKIDHIVDGFDTILFSLFWSDISEEYIMKLNKYKKVRIVCSGHRYDWNFLARQKSLIKLADVTMSNGTGTNLVYCTYLRKPHWLINQRITRSAKDDSGIVHLDFIKKNVDTPNIKDKFIAAFGNYSESLTDAQYELCRETFGFDNVLSPNKMNDLLHSLY